MNFTSKPFSVGQEPLAPFGPALVESMASGLVSGHTVDRLEDRVAVFAPTVDETLRHFRIDLVANCREKANH